MPYNKQALDDLVKKYYILPYASFVPALPHREMAQDTNVHELIQSSGYEWNEEKKAYIEDRTGQTIAALPNGMFIWLIGSVGKVLKNDEKLKAWLQGRGGEFLTKLYAVSGEQEHYPTTFSVTGDRGFEYTPKPKGDPTDLQLVGLKKQVAKNGGLPSDMIIDLGLKAQKEKNTKMLDFLKHVRSLKEHKIKRSSLESLIREIVKGVVNEGSYNKLADPDPDDEIVYNIAKKVWGDKDWWIVNDRRSQYGRVYLVGIRASGDKSRFFVWKTPEGKWKILHQDPKTREKQWQDVPISEESGTGAVSPVSTPFAFSKKKTMESELGVSNEKVNEMTTTGDVSGYNIPAAFTKKGGSDRGVEGSEKLGYTLTPIGKKEMSRRADKLYETKDKELTHGTPICKFCNKPLRYAGQIECQHCGKVQYSDKS